MTEHEQEPNRPEWFWYVDSKPYDVEDVRTYIEHLEAKCATLGDLLQHTEEENDQLKVALREIRTALFNSDIDTEGFFSIVDGIIAELDI